MARNKYDVDEVLEDKFDVNQLKRLLSYLIPYRKRFVSVGFMMLSAVLTLVGVVNIPIIKFSVDWWNTLHQDRKSVV